MEANSAHSALAAPIDPNLWLTIAAFLIAGALVIYAWRQAAELARRVALLAAACDALSAQIESLADTRAFKARFKALAADVQGIAPLDAGWREYSAMLVDLGEGAPIGAAAPASRVFNADLAYRAGLDLRRFDEIPNRLVGAGLFFTFVGLTLSIWLANTGGDTAHTLAALRLLLKVAATKFVTSLFAIGASLWFTWRREAILGGLDLALERLCAALDGKTVPATEAQVAEATRAELGLQTGLLAQTGRDEALAAAIAGALEKTLYSSLAGALEPVAREINAMGAQLGQQNVEALRQMVERFSAQLGGAARQHADELGGILSSAGRAMRGAPEAIDAASTRFAALIEREAQTFDARVQGVTAGLADAVGAGAAAQAALAGRMDRLAQTLGTLDERLTARLAGGDTATAETARLLADVSARLDTATRALVPIARIVERLDAAADALAQGARSVEGVGAAGNAATAAMDRAAATFGADIERLDQTVARVFDRIAVGIEGFERGVARFTGSGTDERGEPGA